ncbi:hypothetical protein U9M48_043328 [Paspalum notatum var. saurae]|uniref:Uncharacterized protein n=1 Tax=Paspalum notatum var. saurae TaxID=547442 RepID=A0AAQ3USY5_PASNO
MRGKRLSVDGNTVRHRLGSKSGSRPPAQPAVPFPRASAGGRRRRGRFCEKAPVVLSIPIQVQCTIHRVYVYLRADT